MKHFILLLLLPVSLIAYAPLIDKGRVVTDITYGYFDTDRFYDKEGNNLFSHNSFQRHEVNAEIEVGVSNRDNFIFKLGYDSIEDHLNGDINDPNEAEVRWKRALISWDDAILSSELIGVIPLENDYEPEQRYGRWGAEAAILYAQTYSCLSKKITLDGRLAYRWYSGFPSDQIRSEISAWIDLSCRWQFLVQSRVEYGLDNGEEPFNVSFFFYNAKYRIWKGKAEAIYYINDRLAISAGYMHHFMGERVAVGGEVYGKLMFCF